jgi:hypothetical protein
LRTLASVFVIYGVASLAHGSGFLAVFIAGIILGDARAPLKREIERFHSALASLAEIVAFVILGLTVSLADLVTNPRSGYPGWSWPSRSRSSSDPSWSGCACCRSGCGGGRRRSSCSPALRAMPLSYAAGLLKT